MTRSGPKPARARVGARGARRLFFAALFFGVRFAFFARAGAALFAGLLAMGFFLGRFFWAGFLRRGAMPQGCQRSAASGYWMQIDRGRQASLRDSVSSGWIHCSLKMVDVQWSSPSREKPFAQS